MGDPVASSSIVDILVPNTPVNEVQERRLLTTNLSDEECIPDTPPQFKSSDAQAVFDLNFSITVSEPTSQTYVIFKRFCRSTKNVELVILFRSIIFVKSG